MNDKDFIRKAVELADGWGYGIEDEGTEDELAYLENADDTFWYVDEENIDLRSLPRIFMDALAAQLVRQVDALGTHFVGTAPMGSTVYEIISSVSERPIMKSHGDGRTMNTIKAIVDSGVLDRQESSDE